MPESTAPASAAEQVGARVPDFFIVGHPKTGTTALYQMLRAHPQIYMPDVKEPRFFASDLGPLPKRREREPGERVMYPTTLAEYLALFEDATPDQRIGEATPTYLRSHVAAAAIAQAQPAARIIAMFREPASFLRSLHLQRLESQTETEPDLMRAIALEESRRRGVLAPGDKPRARWLLYEEFVHYVEQLRRYEAVFPREQMLVLIYDDFRRDNEQTLREILRFVEVDDSVAIERVQANPTVALRSGRLESLARGTSAKSAVGRALVRAVTPPRVRARLRKRAVYRDPAPVDEALMMQLRRRFKPEVEALSEYIDRDLVTLWGYDSLD